MQILNLPVLIIIFQGRKPGCVRLIIFSFDRTAVQGVELHMQPVPCPADPGQRNILQNRHLLKPGRIKDV